MSRQVGVFPLLRCSGTVTVKCVTFGRGSELLGSDTHELFKPFRGRIGDLIRDDTMVAVCPDESDRESVSRATTALQFVLLQRYDLFLEHVTPYWIAPGEAESSTWVANTRIGLIVGNGEFRISPPWPLTADIVHLGNFNFECADLLADCGAERAIASERRLFRAAQIFMRARAVSLGWEEQVPLLAMASEALLDVPSTDIRRQLVERFAATFDNEPAIVHWAEIFYDLRSRIVHGDLITEQDRVYHSPTNFGTAAPMQRVTNQVMKNQIAGNHDEVAHIVVETALRLKLLAICDDDPVNMLHFFFHQLGVRAVTSAVPIFRRIGKLSTGALRDCSQELAKLLRDALALLPETPPNFLDYDRIEKWRSQVEKKLRSIGNSAGSRECAKQLSDILECLKVWEQYKPKT